MKCGMTQVWLAVLSLVGVVLGGGLSYLVQTTVQRRNERSERRRLVAERGDKRREEQLDLLRQFIRVAQQAERAAEDRLKKKGPAWKAKALDVVDELWVCERMIHVLFAPSLHSLARAYVKALDHVVWQETDDGSLWDYLRGPKVAFLDAARDELSRPLDLKGS
ncbi:hypothetical protein SAMN04489727_9506 [Amycolatopsis tolypomycina]|uniref:Uncharacterized protein n=2 Tax=Amycolatopsis tolypomycina TaxID=208445 RepID=A0A1H5DPS3_9PSEU|nr:hypothetical protein SAMN04489727_9506 [Amycolatopsis tolypomycina]